MRRNAPARWLSGLRRPFTLRFPHVDPTARVRIVRACLALTAGLAPLALLGGLLGGRAPAAILAMQAGLSLAALGLLVALQLGRPRLACWGLIAALLAYGIGASAALGTLRTPTTSILLITVALAGLLLGGRAMLGVAAASTGWILALGVAEVRGAVSRTELEPMLATPLSFVLLLVAVVMLVEINRRVVEEALERARLELQERHHTERALQQREAELRASEEKYRLISEVISDYTFSTRLGDGGELVLDWVAGAFEPITGYRFEDYVARGGWRAALHPDDAEADARAMAELRANRPAVSEVRTFTGRGELRRVRVYAHPVWDAAASRLVGIYGAVQDVTPRKQIEAEREALIAELHAKNAELEAYTYVVSHDLRSPLVTIRGFLGFLEGQARAGEVNKLAADVRRIDGAVRQMERLLEHLLALSRAGRVINTPGPVELEGVAREAAALAHGRLAEAGVELVLEPGLPVVLGDRARLVQVLQNLLDNAAKHTGRQSSPRVVVGSRGTEGGQAVVCVKDNGAGIAAENLERVFGLFETIGRRRDGTGIGLALVRRIVESHGGRVWVESEGPERGSCFLFSLPEARA